MCTGVLHCKCQGSGDRLADTGLRVSLALDDDNSGAVLGNAFGVQFPVRAARPRDDLFAFESSDSEMLGELVEQIRGYF